MNNGTLSLVGSLLSFYDLRYVKRKGWLERDVPPDLAESVLGHSLRAARAAFLYTGDVVLTTMLTIHDWPEVKVGDITPKDEIPKDVKHQRERAAMAELTQPLPYGQRIMNLWLEYDAGETRRASLAQQFDKLDSAVMALYYESIGYKRAEEFYPWILGKLHDSRLVEIWLTLKDEYQPKQNPHKHYFGLLKEV